MDTHEFDRTVLGLRVTFLRVLASVRSMTRSHRLYSDNKLTLGKGEERVSTLALHVLVLLMSLNLTTYGASAKS